ncbi:hypothetical protein RDABS01_025262 [Bienertia sinuspersici]
MTGDCGGGLWSVVVGLVGVVGWGKGGLRTGSFRVDLIVVVVKGGNVRQGWGFIDGRSGQGCLWVARYALCGGSVIYYWEKIIRHH